MSKTVAITGGTGTLGRACVARFNEGGWIVHGSRIQDVDKSYPSVDVTSNYEVYQWINGIGRIDAMVTCAGVSAVGDSLILLDDDWRRVIDVNLTGTFLAARTAMKFCATRIVTIGSIHGCTPTSYPQRAAYTASKGGVKALTEALAVEFAPQGVAVNCVAPGHLPQLMDGTGAGQELLDAARNRTPMGKLATAKEVAEVIFWLCDSAPLSLTGNTLVVDGAFSRATYPL